MALPILAVLPDAMPRCDASGYAKDAERDGRKGNAMSGLRDYDVNRDKFEADLYGTLVFPCCCCKYKHGSDDAEPCRTCDHNANAVRDEDAKGGTKG
jgi:hypothetical protein